MVAILKLVKAACADLQKPAIQAQVVAAAVALTGSFGFHLPATDVGMAVAAVAAIYAFIVKYAG